MSLSYAPHLDILPVDGRGLVTISEHGCDVYSGLEFVLLATLVDGERDEPEVLAAAQDAEREALAGAIAQLRRAGVLIERNGASARPDAAWWSSQRVSPDDAATRIRSTTVSVRALGEVDPSPTIEALTAGELQVADDAELTIVLVADYLEEGLAELNRTAIDADRSWMLAQPEGAKILVGPVFIPEQGPCWECLAERLRKNRGLERRIRWLAGDDDGALGAIEAPGSAQRLGPALIATEVLRWISGARPGLESMIMAFDGRTWESGRHQIPWRPQCPECGAGETTLARGANPIRVRRRRPASGNGQTLRSVSPEKTLERFEHHVSPMTGAVHVLSRTSGPDHLHAYLAGGPIARIHGSKRGWEAIEDMFAGGKGTTDQAARASALCEALERHSGEFFGNEPRRQAVMEELGDAAIHPNDYMRFSERQFDERQRWNQKAGSMRTFVPERFDPSVPIDWSPIWSLSHERERWLPTALCYYRAHVPGAAYCVGESNGNAAGNTVEEAILHGILELVERDHVAMWWYNRIPAPGVDLDSINEPWLWQLRRRLASEGREMWALDLTADLGIPAAAALVASPDGSGVGMGLGAHVDLRSAVIRAATELAQLGLGAPSGGLGTGVDPALHLRDHPFARPDPDAPLRICSPEETFSGDVIAALEHCRVAIERQGLELLVLDQTRPDIGLPVVKAIVPGMRHFWPRFGPGRLYDVPVALGRLAHARREDELNPTPPVP